MLIRICDKCKREISEPINIFERELCSECSKDVEQIVNDWVDGNCEAPAVCSAPLDDEHIYDWHSQQLGFPSERGFYLVTVEYNNGDYTTRNVRIAKFTGSPCWYKPGKEYGLIEETGGRVTAWAELPEAYQRVPQE